MVARKRVARKSAKKKSPARKAKKSNGALKTLRAKVVALKKAHKMELRKAIAKAFKEGAASVKKKAGPKKRKARRKTVKKAK